MRSFCTSILYTGNYLLCYLKRDQSILERSWICLFFEVWNKTCLQNGPKSCEKSENLIISFISFFSPKYFELWEKQGFQIFFNEAGRWILFQTSKSRLVQTRRSLIYWDTGFPLPNLFISTLVIIEIYFIHDLFVINYYIRSKASSLISWIRASNTGKFQQAENGIVVT